LHKRLQESVVGNEVMVRVHPERFPPGTLKKLHAQSKGLYRISRRFDIPWELGINPVFNIEDLTPYHSPVDHPIVIPYPPSSNSTGPQPFSVHPPPPLRRLHNEEIEDNFGGLDHLDCRWGIPAIPSLLAWMAQVRLHMVTGREDHLAQPEFAWRLPPSPFTDANISKLGRVDGDPTGTWKTNFRRRCMTWVQVHGGHFHLL